MVELKQRLEELLKEEPKLHMNGNWGTIIPGRNGNYFLYSLMYKDHSVKYKDLHQDLSGSDQWILVKKYVDNRTKGKYSVLSDKSVDFDDIDQVIEEIKSIVPK